VHQTEGQPVTAIFLMVSVINRGARGSLGGWKLHYHSDTMDTTVQFSKLFTSPFKDERSRKMWHFYEADNIYEKTMQPVESGALVRGWTMFDIPGDHSADFQPNRPQRADLTLIA
jgi:hypothetical protein